MKALLIVFLAGIHLPFAIEGSLILNIALSVVTIVVISFLRSEKVFFFLFSVVVYLSGIFISSSLVVERVKQQLPEEWEKIPLTLNIEILGLPMVEGGQVRFTAKVLSFDTSLFASSGANLPLPRLEGRRVNLSWRCDDACLTEPGQRWRLSVKLKRPRGLVNPHGFDYQAWLLSQNIVATGYVLGRHETYLEGNVVLSLDRVRSRISEWVDRSLEHKEVGALISALLVADKRQMSQKQWKILADTGTTHLMAISGLHVGLISVFGFFFGKLFVRIGWVKGLLGGKLLPVIVSAIFALSYAALAGFSVPTQRALFVLLLFSFLHVAGKRVSNFTLLLIAACIILVLNPFHLLSAGFWLSFVAVATLLWVYGSRFSFVASRLQAGSSIVFGAQYVAFFGLFIPLALFGLPNPLIGIVANAIAIPLMSFLVMPLLFFSLMMHVVNDALAIILLELGEALIVCLWDVLDFLSRMPSVDHYFSLPNSMLAIVCAAAAVVMMLVPSFFQLRLLGVAIFFAIAVFAPSINKSEKMMVMDVGQGLAFVHAYPAGKKDVRAAIYDTGARYSERFDMGQQVLNPYLKFLGVRQIERLVVSHSDNDHSGGVNSVLESYQVEEVYLGAGNFGFVHDDLLVKPAHDCQAGQEWSVGKAIYSVLWPEKLSRSSGLSVNNGSCVILVTIENHSILLAGDIEKEAEVALLASGRLPQNIGVLVVPHHGSKTSSSIRFVHHLHPKHVVFSAGYKNRYRHPSQSVLERYRKIHATIWNTALNGAVSIEFEGRNLRVYGERNIVVRPWFDK